MVNKSKSSQIIVSFVIGLVGVGLGYYSFTHGSMINKIVSIVPFITGLVYFVNCVALIKEKNNKTKKTILSDLRIYYVLALLGIILFPPMNYHESIKFIYFDGWYPISYLGDDMSLNLTYLTIEFIFITIVFLLFYKKK